MTRHLNDAEWADALGGTLPPARQSHLDACAACRQDVSLLLAMQEDLRDIGDGDVPEPSPLFWDHFHGRVTAAVDVIADGSVPWWRGSTRAWMSLATAAAVVLMAVAVWPRSTAPAPIAPDQSFVDSTGDSIGESVQWQFVTDVLDTLEPDAARSVLEPSAQAVDAAFARLTESERAAFARLLQAELSEGSE